MSTGKTDLQTSPEATPAARAFLLVLVPAGTAANHCF